MVHTVKCRSTDPGLSWPRSALLGTATYKLTQGGESSGLTSCTRSKAAKHRATACFDLIWH
eukprot:4194371-Prorocentrum_lima.AAC.1